MAKSFADFIRETGYLVDLRAQIEALGEEQRRRKAIQSGLGIVLKQLRDVERQAGEGNKEVEALLGLTPLLLMTARAPEEVGAISAQLVSQATQLQKKIELGRRGQEMLKSMEENAKRLSENIVKLAEGKPPEVAQIYTTLGNLAGNLYQTQSQLAEMFFASGQPEAGVQVVANLPNVLSALTSLITGIQEREFIAEHQKKMAEGQRKHEKEMAKEQREHEERMFEKRVSADILLTELQDKLARGRIELEYDLRRQMFIEEMKFKERLAKEEREFWGRIERERINAQVRIAKEKMKAAIEVENLRHIHKLKEIEEAGKYQLSSLANAELKLFSEMDVAMKEMAGYVDNGQGLLNNYQKLSKTGKYRLEYDETKKKLMIVGEDGKVVGEYGVQYENVESFKKAFNKYMNALRKLQILYENYRITQMEINLGEDTNTMLDWDID